MSENKRVDRCGCAKDSLERGRLKLTYDEACVELEPNGVA